MNDNVHLQHHASASSELSQWAFSILAAALVCWLGLISVRRVVRPQTKKQPPGPWELPLVGSLGISSTASLFRRSVEWTKRYGPIFRVKIGTANVVILSDLEHIKKFYSSKDGVVRPSNAILEELRPSTKIVPGISNLNGEAWTQNRTFILRVFGDLGFGKPSMEDHIMEELQELVSRISNTTGCLINVKDYITASVSNIIAAVMFGSRFQIGDAKHDYIVKLVRNVLDGSESGLMVDKKPNWLSRVAISLQTKAQVNQKSRLMMQDFVKEQITEHKNTLNPDFNRDFIDGYLKKIKESDSDSASHFNENNLLGNAAEFLLTGTGPSSTRIFWFLHICAQNPNSVQNKIQKEIDDVVGPHRQPTWEDRKKMPFTVASLKEGLRWKTIGPIGGSRGTLKDTFIGEYFIPKGTIVLLNLRAVHRNPAYWKNPDEFDPTRFLTIDGKLLEKNEDYFIPFGIGRRNCPGQVLGNVQMFLYTTTLLQNFNVLPEYQDQLDSIGSPDLATADPRVRKLRFVPR